MSNGKENFYQLDSTKARGSGQITAQPVKMNLNLMSGVLGNIGRNQMCPVIALGGLNVQLNLAPIEQSAFMMSSTIQTTAAPPTRTKGDLVIKNFKNILKKKTFKKLIYLSATNVYGNHDGKWVTEESKLKAKTINGKNRMLAEKQWLSLKNKYNLNIDILRLSGIYSEENNALKRLKSGLTTFVKKNNHFHLLLASIRGVRCTKMVVFFFLS